MILPTVDIDTSLPVPVEGGQRVYSITQALERSESKDLGTLSGWTTFSLLQGPRYCARCLYRDSRSLLQLARMFSIYFQTSACFQCWTWMTYHASRLKRSSNKGYSSLVSNGCLHTRDLLRFLGTIQICKLGGWNKTCSVLIKWECSNLEKPNTRESIYHSEEVMHPTDCSVEVFSFIPPNRL